MTARLALALGALLAAAAVAFGAFGAHALKSRLGSDALAIWQTAVQYHAWHALGLIAVGLLLLQWPERSALAWAGWAFVAGVALFSGSLYALALTGTRGLGAIAPIGGVAFIAGWIALAFAAWRR
jgi:uncharacterized membrane protein YgdD (TMEM256/DUF423 family)